MILYLVRHTESKAQTEEEYSLDANLSDFGVQQAKCLHTALSELHFDKIFLSPLKRARQTFEYSGVKKENVYFDSRLAEELPAGMYADNILPYEQTPDYGVADIHDAWETPVNERIAAFIRDIREMKKCESVLVVCHAAVLNRFLQLFLEPQLTSDEISNRPKCHMDNGAISIFEIHSSTQDRLVKWNDTNHL